MSNWAEQFHNLDKFYKILHQTDPQTMTKKDNVESHYANMKNCRLHLQSDHLINRYKADLKNSNLALLAFLTHPTENN